MIIGNHRFIIPILLLVSARVGMSLNDTTNQSLLEVSHEKVASERNTDFVGPFLYPFC